MKKAFFLAIVFLILNQGNSDSAIQKDNEENRCKVLSKKIFTIIDRIDKVPFEYRKIYKEDGREILMADFSKRGDFIKKNKRDIDQIEKDLRNYINQKKDNNKWVDDAIFSLVALYNILNQTDNSYTDKTIKYLKMFIELKRQVHMENYTCSLFNKTTTKWFLKDIPDEEWTKNMSLDERLIQYYYRLIIGELVRADRYEDAKIEMEDLKPYIDKGNLITINKLMDSWLEIKRLTIEK